MKYATYNAYHHPELGTVKLLPNNKEEGHNCVSCLFSYT